jgi:hypothetical protein
MKSETSGAMTRALFVYLAFAVAVIAVTLVVQHHFLDEQAVLLGGAPGLTLVTLAALWFGRPGATALVDRLVAPMATSSLRPLWVLIGATFLALVFVAVVVLDRFPNSGDEYAYVLQARTYALGRLWVEAPPLPDFFSFSRFFAKDGIWVSPYQPGWSLVMAPAAAVGLPLWIVNPLLGAATVAAFFVLARQVLERPAAWIATLALVTSPFFLLNFGSYFSHGIGALTAILFAIFANRYLRLGTASAAILAGVFLGYLGFVRAFNAVLLAVPFGLALLATPRRRIGMIWFGLGGIPFLAALLYYYFLVTGHPLVPVQDWYHPGAEPLGAPSESTFTETARRLVRLYFYTSPIMLFAWAASILEIARRRRLQMVDWIFPVTVGAFVFYGGHGGDQYGPRYLFEAWPFAILTVMRAVEPLLFAGPRGRASAWAASALMAHLVFQLSYGPARMTRDHQIIMEHQDIYAQVKRTGLTNAVVMVRGRMSRTHSMGADGATRNGLKIAGQPVLYVLDLGPRNGELRARFPGRTFYVYADGALTPAPD